MLIVSIVSLHTVTARHIPSRGQRPLTTCCGSGRSHLRLSKLSRLERSWKIRGTVVAAPLISVPWSHVHAWMRLCPPPALMTTQTKCLLRWLGTRCSIIASPRDATCAARQTPLSPLRSKYQDRNRPLCLCRLTPVLLLFKLKLKVMVALPGAVADRPLLLRDENPMPGGGGQGSRRDRLCSPALPGRRLTRDAGSSLRSASVICLPVQPIILSCTPLLFCNHD